MHKELDHINNERHIDRGNSLFVIKQRIFVTYHPRVLPILPNCTHRYASRSIPLERSYRGRNSSTPTLQLGYEWGFPPSAEMHGGATIRWGARVELMAISWLGFEICNRRMWLREFKEVVCSMPPVVRAFGSHDVASGVKDRISDEWCQELNFPATLFCTIVPAFFTSVT